MPPGFESLLTNMGLPGLMIFGLGWHALRMDRRAQEAQEARLLEVQTILKALEASTHTMERTGEAMRTLVDLVRGLSR